MTARAKTPSASRQVLVLLGSPREDGNSTRLAFAFADAASALGHRVQSVRVPALDFAPCNVCNECRPSAKAPCVLQDDLQSLYPLLHEADVLVWATPLWFHTWSSSLKLLIDRLYCLAPYRRVNLAGRDSILIATSANPSPSVFAGLKTTYRMTAEFMQWRNLGELLVPGLSDPDAVAALPRPFVRAAALAAKIGRP